MPKDKVLIMLTPRSVSDNWDTLYTRKDLNVLDEEFDVPELDAIWAWFGNASPGHVLTADGIYFVAQTADSTSALTVAKLKEYRQVRIHAVPLSKHTGEPDDDDPIYDTDGNVVSQPEVSSKPKPKPGYKLDFGAVIEDDEDDAEVKPLPKPRRRIGR